VWNLYEDVQSFRLYLACATSQLLIWNIFSEKIRNNPKGNFYGKSLEFCIGMFKKMVKIIKVLHMPYRISPLTRYIMRKASADMKNTIET
jgi:hypothetical protein